MIANSRVVSGLRFCEGMGMQVRKSKWLGRDFFRNSPIYCARELVGCELVWGECSGIVLETETYLEFGDEACHTFTRKGARRFIEDHDAGAAYIYLNYGMYWLANVLVKGDENGFVLLRGLRPKMGIEIMKTRRNRTSVEQLCSGPGKLTVALGINGSDHGVDWCAGRTSGRGFLQKQTAFSVEATSRIGISKAVDLPWRFVAAEDPV